MESSEKLVSRYCSCEEPQLIKSPSNGGYYCNECELNIPEERAKLLQEPRSKSKPRQVKHITLLQSMLQRRQAERDLLTIKEWLRFLNISGVSELSESLLNRIAGTFGNDTKLWPQKIEAEIKRVEEYLAAQKAWAARQAHPNLRALPKKKQRQLGLLPPV
jgi:hypothetical protein